MSGLPRFRTRRLHEHLEREGPSEAALPNVAGDVLHRSRREHCRCTAFGCGFRDGRRDRGVAGEGGATWPSRNRLRRPSRPWTGDLVQNATRLTPPSARDRASTNECLSIDGDARVDLSILLVERNGGGEGSGDDLITAAAGKYQAAPREVVEPLCVLLASAFTCTSTLAVPSGARRRFGDGRPAAATAYHVVCTLGHRLTLFMV